MHFIFERMSSHILVNGDPTNQTIFWVYNLTDQINIVTIIWNYYLSNNSSMFAF